MTLQDRLLTFATQGAPYCIGRLPTPFPHTPKSIRNTKAEFLLRVALEGRDILDRGDSQLSEFRFTADDINSVYRGFLVLEQLIRSPQTSPEHLEDFFSAAQKSLPKIATYYEDKIAISKITKERARKDIPKAWASLEKLYNDRNFKALLKFYPGFEMLMELDDEQPTQSAPIPSGIVSLDSARHIKKVASIFEREAKGGGSHMGSGLSGMIGWLGKPEHIRRFQKEVELCTAQIGRNTPVLDAIHTVSEQMKTTLEGPPSNVVAFRAVPELRV